MKRTQWYSLDSNSEVSEISIFDQIGFWGVSVQDFAADFTKARSSKRINITINSPGGSVTDGWAIYNLIASERAKVHVEVIGLAASMASVIALAGSTLTMGEGSFLMIHEPWTVVMGTAEDLRHDAGVLEKMRKDIVSVYAAHSSLSVAEIEELMKNETWMTAEEAKKHGFASAVKRVAAAASLKKDIEDYGFKKIPKELLSQQDFGEIKTIRGFEQFLRDAGAGSHAAVALASGGWKALHRDGAEAEPVTDLSPLINSLKERAKIFQ